MLPRTGVVSDRTRLNPEEQESALAEAPGIDSDVAQVLDAQASPEKERRRLDSELDDKSRIAGAARRVAKVPVGTAADVKKDVDRERSAIFDKSDLIEDVMQGRHVQPEGVVGAGDQAPQGTRTGVQGIGLASD